jgi:hypothetical protein
MLSVIGFGLLAHGSGQQAPATQEPVKPTQTIAAYIMSWEMQNDACQGGDQQACRYRDATLLAIESQGWCLSDTKKWQPAPCNRAQQPTLPVQEPTQEPAGCLQATAHTSGPCKLTYPNGMSVETFADGTTWVDMKDYRFQIFKESGTITGNFQDTVIIKMPMAPDVIQKQQWEKLSIYGDCVDRSYVVYGSLFTDVNGYFTIDGGMENFKRRVMPGTALDSVFKFTCISSVTAHEHSFKEGGLNPGYRTYTNNRYGFRIEYPLTFIPQPPPDNGDGQDLKSQDGKATLAVSGENDAGLTLKDAFERSIKSVRGQLGYNKMGAGWFVVTWTDGSSVGYTKEFVGSRSQNSFTITFPVQQKSQYDSIVTAIEKSFRPGDLDNSH